MRVVKSREIVLEVERIQVVRRRSKSWLMFCERCAGNVDFMSAEQAALLFGTNLPDLFLFVKEYDSHFTVNTGGEYLICINSLVNSMNAQTNKLQIKMINGESEK